MKKILESIGLPVWIALMIIGFIWFWPIGLAILCYLVWAERVRWFGPRAANLFGSGNRAFDEHRAEQMKAFEQEREDFDSFLVKLAEAKDRTEFDSFIQSRNGAKN